MNRVILLSGPSGTGKTPLMQAVDRKYPDIAAKKNKVVLFTSRDVRPGETEGKDYYFRPREEIQKLPSDNHIIFPVRNDLQALSIKKLEEVFLNPEAIGFLEIFHNQTQNIANRLKEKDIYVTTVFMSPFSAKDIRNILVAEGEDELTQVLAEYVATQIALRVSGQKGSIQVPDVQEIVRRSIGVFNELRSAPGFDHVLVCHHGEHDQIWKMSPNTMIGEPRDCRDAMVEILKGNSPSYSEHWDKTLFAV